MSMRHAYIPPETVDFTVRVRLPDQSEVDEHITLPTSATYERRSQSDFHGAMFEIARLIALDRHRGTAVTWCMTLIVGEWPAWVNDLPRHGQGSLLSLPPWWQRLRGKAPPSKPCPLKVTVEACWI